ncbi:hypothetical protein NPIL_337201 [Nephila pilipes]|uniref:Uncharacterized protein n=1 Tax=Nephila pilipes TaxID=299642 RepID=A0A8X6UNN8_NEPPI|nr:hypothetical protein NPIL_337201 [Nephila pilipes]
MKREKTYNRRFHHNLLTSLIYLLAALGISYRCAGAKDHDEQWIGLTRCGRGDGEGSFASTQFIREVRWGGGREGSFHASPPMSVTCSRNFTSLLGLSAGRTLSGRFLVHVSK